MIQLFCTISEKLFVSVEDLFLHFRSQLHSGVDPKNISCFTNWIHSTKQRNWDKVSRKKLPNRGSKEVSECYIWQVCFQTGYIVWRFSEIQNLICCWKRFSYYSQLGHYDRQNTTIFAFQHFFRKRHVKKISQTFWQKFSSSWTCCGSQCIKLDAECEDKDEWADWYVLRNVWQGSGTIWKP